MPLIYNYTDGLEVHSHKGMFKVKVVADSIHDGVRITTLAMTYPRFILAEVNTHGLLAKSTSSSRAIPSKKLRKMALEHTAMPVHWGKNQAGMQAYEELKGWRLFAAKKVWKLGAFCAVGIAKLLDIIGVHKQICNRGLETYSHASTTITATDWKNLLALRDHPAAQPEFQALAKCIKYALMNSVPKELKEDEWHLPFITDEDRDNINLGKEDLLKMSVARCARTSYNNHLGKTPSYEEDMKLYARLLGSEPRHSSPADQPAQAMGGGVRYGRFRGWKAYRESIPNNAVSEE